MIQGDSILRFDLRILRLPQSLHASIDLELRQLRIVAAELGLDLCLLEKGSELLEIPLVGRYALRHGRVRIGLLLRLLLGRQIFQENYGFVAEPYRPVSGDSEEGLIVIRLGACVGTRTQYLQAKRRLHVEPPGEAEVIRESDIRERKKVQTETINQREEDGG